MHSSLINWRSDGSHKMHGGGRVSAKVEIYFPYGAGRIGSVKAENSRVCNGFPVLGAFRLQMQAMQLAAASHWRFCHSAQHQAFSHRVRKTQKQSGMPRSLRETGRQTATQREKRYFNERFLCVCFETIHCWSFLLSFFPYLLPCGSLLSVSCCNCLDFLKSITHWMLLGRPTPTEEATYMPTVRRPPLPPLPVTTQLFIQPLNISHT